MLLLTFPCSLHGSGYHELQWSQHVTRWSHLAAFLKIAQVNLGWYGVDYGLGLRSSACMRIKMAK